MARKRDKTNKGKSKRIIKAKSEGLPDLKMESGIIKYLRRHWSSFLSIVLGLVSIALTIITLHLYYQDKRIATISGYLSASNSPLRNVVRRENILGNINLLLSNARL